MADEARLLTAEEVAAMREDVDRQRAGLDPYGLGPVQLHPEPRWGVERIVATLESLMAENARLTAEGERMMRKPGRLFFEPTLDLNPTHATNAEGHRFRWDSAVGWIMETDEGVRG